MNKEINPNLFSGQGPDLSREQPPGLSFDPATVFRSDRHIDKLELRKIEEKFELTNDRVQEAIKTMTLKAEKLTQKHVTLDQKLDGLIQESRAKYAQLSGKVSEKSHIEGEVQSLLERHNQLVRNFESRLTQMQRVVESQQMQIMNYSAALDEARREIARMKRL